MKKIKRYILRLLRALPFGLQGAEREIMGSSNTGEDGTVITQEVSDERVSKHLLKGEVTQEVEELRYRTYKVAGESENYNYLGNGVAVKKEEKTEKKTERTKFNVTQENKIICSSILNELKHIDDYGVENYRIEITYNDVVRFKLEQFANAINVRIDEKNDVFETSLRFWKEPDKYNTTSRQFLNELKKAVELKNAYAISRNEILTSIKTISFCTYKASGDDDFTIYGFTEGCKYKGSSETDDEYILTFTWDSYTRIPINLESKYYSKSMDDKYRNHTRKNVEIMATPVEKKYFCQICGAEVDEYSASIQMADGKPIICKNCMKKTIEKS